ncbi:MAG: XdhC family protein [Desulforhopalus sp.]|nr:XdhC family protein [Desulforhopalus sp.]
MQHLFDHLVESLALNQTAVLGTIVRSSGSAPRTSGARMLVKNDGSLVGTVGGGAVESACQARARELLDQDEQYAILDFQLTAASAADTGMLCGGAVSVLLIKVQPPALPLFQELQRAYRNGERPMLVTSLPKSGSMPQLRVATPDAPGDLPPGLWREITRKQRRASFLSAFDHQEYFVEPLVHPGTVHLIGAGHVALATAVCADFAGFEVVVMDDRAEFANAERYPQARAIQVLSSFDNCLGKLGPDDYVVIVTRGHLHDQKVLEQALTTGAGYIGMIGSKRKQEAICRALLDQGFTETDLQRVHSPIGLAIGADTPEEIAVSIVAELVKARAGLSQ